MVTSTALNVENCVVAGIKRVDVIIGRIGSILEGASAVIRMILDSLFYVLAAVVVMAFMFSIYVTLSSDRCDECGGKLTHWGNGKYFCPKCEGKSEA